MKIDKQKCFSAPPRPPSPLIRRRFRHRHHGEGLHARARVVGVLLAEARIDHEDDVVDRDGRLGDIRTEDLGNGIKFLIIIKNESFKAAISAIKSS